MHEVVSREKLEANETGEAFGLGIGQGLGIGRDFGMGWKLFDVLEPATGCFWREGTYGDVRVVVEVAGG